MYAKLFGSIVHSTIWREPDYVRLLWITMLALADKHGYVWASVPGLADAARIDLDQCKDALERFQSPDEYSRSQEYEGRRIEQVDGGFWIINYDKFQSIKNMDERREKVREAVQRHRDRAKQRKNTDEHPVINVINRNQTKSDVSPSDQAKTQINKRPRAKNRAVNTTAVFALGPYLDAYEAVFPDSTVPAKRFAAAFKALEAKHGAEETLRRWVICLAQKGTWATPNELGAHWSAYDGIPTASDPWKHLAGYPDVVLEDGTMTEYGERVTRPAGLKVHPHV